MKKPLIIYHGQCSDGFGSAFAARHHFMQQNIEPEFYPAVHGVTPIPDVKNREVYICDFSYSRDVLLKMRSEAAFIVVLDHHKTAQESLAGLDFCHFDMARSGAAMTWDYFNPAATFNRPWLINYIQDIDLWAWQLPDSKEVCEVIRNTPHDFKLWEALSNRSLEDVIQEGKILLNAKMSQISFMMKHVYISEYEGQEVAVINSSMFKDEIPNILAQYYPFAVCWLMSEVGTYKYSLRSRNPEVDVSQIAARFGGGGHRKSAGFASETQIFPFRKKLNKAITQLDYTKLEV